MLSSPRRRGRKRFSLYEMRVENGCCCARAQRDGPADGRRSNAAADDDAAIVARPASAESSGAAEAAAAAAAAAVCAMVTVMTRVCSCFALSPLQLRLALREKSGRGREEKKTQCSLTKKKRNSFRLKEQRLSVFALSAPRAPATMQASARAVLDKVRERTERRKGQRASEREKQSSLLVFPCAASSSSLPSCSRAASASHAEVLLTSLPSSFNPFFLKQARGASGELAGRITGMRFASVIAGADKVCRRKKYRGSGRKCMARPTCLLFFLSI